MVVYLPYMPFTDGEGEGGGDFTKIIPPRRKILHYHGDKTRVIFVVSAIILILAKSTGADLPLNTFGTVVAAVTLVIAAGVTNPVQFGIHWLNASLSIIGAILFGTTAVDHYRAGLGVFDSSFVYVEALAFLSLLALYFTTRTVRGVHQRHEL